MLGCRGKPPGGRRDKGGCGSRSLHGETTQPSPVGSPHSEERRAVLGKRVCRAGRGRGATVASLSSEHKSGVQGSGAERERKPGGKKKCSKCSKEDIDSISQAQVAGQGRQKREEGEWRWNKWSDCKGQDQRGASSLRVDPHTSSPPRIPGHLPPPRPTLPGPARPFLLLEIFPHCQRDTGSSSCLSPYGAFWNKAAFLQGLIRITGVVPVFPLKTLILLLYPDSETPNDLTCVFLAPLDN